MKIFRRLTVALAVMTSLFTASAAFAEAETNVSSGLTFKGPGLAVHGYDVVAYFTQHKPTFGRAKFSAIHKNARYRFASKANLDAFKADPEAYVPQYGGYCAFGVSVGAKFDGNPRRWKIVDGKLYLNLNEEVRKTWLKDVPNNIRKANDNWKKIVHKTPQQLS
jgi:YHS domain-containing protein